MYYFIIFIITMSIETFLFSFLVLYKSKGNKEESLTELPQVLLKILLHECFLTCKETLKAQDL